MQIDVEFSQPERERLASALANSGQDVDETAELVARAGAREALALATGQVVPGTLAEARAFRIFTLMEQGIGSRRADCLIPSIEVKAAKRCQRADTGAVSLPTRRKRVRRVAPPAPSLRTRLSSV